MIRREESIEDTVTSPLFWGEGVENYGNSVFWTLISRFCRGVSRFSRHKLPISEKISSKSHFPRPISMPFWALQWKLVKFRLSRTNTSLKNHLIVLQHTKPEPNVRRYQFKSTPTGTWHPFRPVWMLPFCNLSSSIGERKRKSPGRKRVFICRWRLRVPAYVMTDTSIKKWLNWVVINCCVLIDRYRSNRMILDGRREMCPWNWNWNHTFLVYRG